MMQERTVDNYAPHLRATFDARNDLDRVLTEIPPSVDNWATQSGVESVLLAHNLLLGYASQIAPKSETLRNDLWDEKVCFVEVPKDEQEIDCGQSNAYGEIQIGNIQSKIEREKMRISLKGLDWWRSKNQITLCLVADGGDITDVRQQTHHLPLAAIRMLQAQLDRCVDDLGWLEEPAVEDFEDTEVL